ncbi:MAG: MarR family transcriptional regulator [Lachnospiraceae bacterium]|nr:MarR family transcriptional regulator [Lachnospiraceae bacterium]
MAKEKYDCLKLENQLCFPLYACAKEIVRRYKPFLDEIDLTYTQYIVMMALWEHENMNVKELGETLYLDSGTLTPVLKKLESKDFIKRERAKKDERNLVITVTARGMKLKEKAVKVPAQMGSCVKLEADEAIVLHKLLHRVLSGFEEKQE